MFPRMKTRVYCMRFAWSRLICIMLLCAIYVLPSQAFTPKDTLHLKKEIQQFSKKNASVTSIVNYLNNKKQFTPPQTLNLPGNARFETEATQNIRGAKINDSIFVAVYQTPSSQKVRAIAGKIKPGGTITFGSPVDIRDMTGPASQNIDISLLGNGNFVIVADEGNGGSAHALYSVTGSVSGPEGTNLVMGDIESANFVLVATPVESKPLGELRVTAISSTKFVVVFTQDVTGGGEFVVHAVTGNVSSGNVTYLSSVVNFSTLNTVAIAVDALSSNQVVVSYVESNNTLQNVILDIGADGTITAGSPVSIITGGPSVLKTDVAVTKANEYVCLYETSGATPAVNIVNNSIAASTITRGTPVVLQSGVANSISVDNMGNNQVVTMVQGASVSLRVVNTTTLDFTHENTFNANNATNKTAFAVGMGEFKIVGLGADTGRGLTVMGDIAPPQLMKVAGNNTPIVDDATSTDPGNGTDFEQRSVGLGSKTSVFTIKNDGSGNMTLGAITFAVATSEFSINTTGTASELGPGQSTTFKVSFLVQTAGVHAATVQIPTNDPDITGGVFDFVVSGEGLNQPPGMEVAGNGTTINSGDPNTKTSNFTKLNTVTIGDSVDVQFDLKNTGGGLLNISNITSDNSAFIVINSISTGIAADAVQSFTVRYKPTTEGEVTAIISIASDDQANPSPFEIIMDGVGAIRLATPAISSKSSTKNKITLNWIDNNTSEQGYIILRARPVGPGGPPINPGPFTQVGLTQSNATNFVDVGLPSNTVYIYKIIAKSAISGQNSAESDTVIIRTKPNTPIAPSSLNALTLSQTEIQLEWQENSTNETGFQIHRKKKGEPAYTLISTLGPNTVFYIDQGLESKTEYFYIVNATGNEGPSPATDMVSAITLSNAPEPPSDLSVVPVSGSELRLEWTDNSDNELGFIIYRGNQQFGTSFTVIDTVPPNTVVYNNVGLTDQTTYFYFVNAFNSDGLSLDRSNIASEKTADVPLVPTNIRFKSLSPTSIEITWDIPNAPTTARNADGFSIEAASLLGVPSAGKRQTHTWFPVTFADGKKVSRTTNDGFANLIFTQIGTVNATIQTFTAANLIPNQKYLFRGRAFNDKGNSPYTPISIVNTAIDPSVPVPNPPTNLKVTAVSQSELDLTWQDNSSNELVFKIERRRNDESTWTEIAQVIGGTTSFSSTDLLADSTYFYRLRASNQGGESSYSNISSAKVECNLVVLVTNNSGINTICSGKAALLVVNTNVSDATYQWKQNGINIPNANLPIYTATETGEYNCQVISGSCSKSSTSPTVVIVKSSFQVSIRVVDSTSNQMQASVSGAQNYQWYRDYQPIPNAVSSRYTPTVGGTYFVVVGNASCSSTSNLININVIATGLEDNQFAQGITLSPNPATSQSLLTMTNDEFGRYKILITDIKGKVQQKLKGVKNTKTIKVALPVQGLPEGLYLVKVSMKEKEGVKKLLKE